MPNIGAITASLVLDTGGYRKAVTDAQKQTTGAGQAAGKAGKGFDRLEQSTGKSTKGFGALGKSLSGVGPSIGGMKLNFAALANPIGLATAAAGAFAAAIIGSVTKVTSLEKELRPMIERSRIGPNPCKSWRRLPNALVPRMVWRALLIPARNCNCNLARLPSWAAVVPRRRWRRWGYLRRN